MQMSLLELWQTMGWFAKSIVFVMAIMSILSLGTALSKWWRLRKAQKETRKFAPEFSRFLQEEQMEGAIALSTKYKNSHVARVLAEVKGDRVLKSIPVVVLTTSKAEEDVVRAYSLQTNCYVTKPVDFTSFSKIVRSIQHFWFTVVTLPPK